MSDTIGVVKTRMLVRVLVGIEALVVVAIGALVLEAGVDEVSAVTVEEDADLAAAAVEDVMADAALAAVDVMEDEMVDAALAAVVVEDVMEGEVSAAAGVVEGEVLEEVVEEEVPVATKDEALAVIVEVHLPHSNG